MRRPFLFHYVKIKIALLRISTEKFNVDFFCW